MGNEGFLELKLLDVVGNPAPEPKLRVLFFRIEGNQQLGSAVTNLSVPPPPRFKLPAFPQEKRLYCRVEPSRFRLRNSETFQLTDGLTTTREVHCTRRPEKWKADFVGWGALPALFTPLKRALERSPNVKVKSGQTLGLFTAGAYDGVSEGAADSKTVFAKTALLNLYTKLSAMTEPVNNAEPWFSFVREIFVIGRERFIASVEPRMGELIREIKQNLSQFKDYKNTPAQNHFENFPASLQVQKSRMFSVKSDEDHANIQLTIAPGKDSDGNEAFYLDADIDENGQLLAHMADLFKHKISGGTHPHDIHEYLTKVHLGRPLGYSLVPKDGN